MPTPRRVVLALTSVLGLMAVAGCSGSDEGWTELTVGHLTVERPSTWTEQTPSGKTWTKKFTGDSLELQISGLFSEDPTASAAVSRLDLPAMVGLEGYDGGAVVKATVPGADTAVRSDFTYTDKGVTKKGIWVIAGQWPYPETSAIAITGENLDGDTVRHIIESLKFTKKQGS